LVKPKPIIRRKAAKDLFNIIINELQQESNLNERTILLVDSMALLEQMKHELLDDLKKRGVVELFKNGSQEMYRDNKSVDKVLKVVEQQRKLLAELKLTPASDKKVSEVVAVDEFEEF
jgi:hypothetical protein